MRFSAAAVAAGCAIGAVATPTSGFVAPLAPLQPPAASPQRLDATGISAHRRRQHAAVWAKTFPFSWSTCVAGAAVMLASSSVLALRAAGSKSKQSRAAAQRMVAQAAFDPSKEVGVTDPIGYWDPASLMKDRTGQWKDEKTFNQWREAEIKHGRLAMMAALGLAAGTAVKFPGFKGVPSGLAALWTPEGGGGFGVVVLLAAFFEVEFWKQDPLKAPGDFGDPLEVGAYKDFGYNTDMRNKEINHGRLAMSAVGTELLVEYGTKLTPDEQLRIFSPGVLFVLFFGLVFIWSNYPQEYPDSSTPAPKALPSTATPALQE